MMRKTASIVRWLGLLSLVLIGFGGCDRPDAPPCLMRAGDWTEIVEEYSAAPRGLKLYDHMHVVLEMDSPLRNCYGGVQKMSSLTGGRVGEGDVLELGHEDRCQWIVTSVPMWDCAHSIIPEIALHGQGRLDATLVDSTMAVAIDAWKRVPHSGMRVGQSDDPVACRCCSAEAEGTAGTVSLFASGLSGVDAAALQSERRSSISPPTLRCTSRLRNTPMSN